MKSLPSIKVDEKTLDNIEASIKKYNSRSDILMKLSKQQFRRLSYELLSFFILSDQPLPIKLLPE